MIMMKRFILAIAAIATLACGCQKFDTRISKLEERISALEQTCADLNTTISAIQKIADAQAAGISIKEVKKVENGFQISFSDGTSYSIVNGAKGDKPEVAAVEEEGKFYWQVNGEWLLDSERNRLPLTGAAPQLKIEEEKWYVSTDDGKSWKELGVAGDVGVKVDVTEDDEAYYFDFGDDNVIKIAKMAVFVLKVGKDSVKVAAKASETISWTLAGEDKTTHYATEASGYSAKIDASAKTITITAGDNTEEGYVIIKAIRNSDGASASQYITVNGPASGEGEGDEEKDCFKVEITDVTATSFAFTITPSDPEMTYLFDVRASEDIDGYDDDTIFAEDMAYLTALASEYGLSLSEALGMLAKKGEASDKIEKLTPKSDYVLYVYGISAQNKRATKLTRVSVTTLEGSASTSGYTAFLGTWNVKGKKGADDYEGTITISQNEEEKSYMISGVGKYNIFAIYNAENNVIQIPLGAPNVIGKFSFSTSGTQWGCWMGYDGKSVYKAGNFYFGISEDGNTITNLNANKDGELIDPIGFAMGVYKLNEDGSIGEYMSSTFGDKYLFSSITKSVAPSSMKASRRNFRAQKTAMTMVETDEKCMLEIR